MRINKKRKNEREGHIMRICFHHCGTGSKFSKENVKGAVARVEETLSGMGLEFITSLNPRGTTIVIEDPPDGAIKDLMDNLERSIQSMQEVSSILP